jgi:serine/threonine protein kinase
VAKAVNQRLVEKTLFTEIGMLIGTPEYMSPEQADAPILDVDSTSDIYSLGVLLTNYWLERYRSTPKCCGKPGTPRSSASSVRRNRPSLRGGSAV